MRKKAQHNKSMLPGDPFIEAKIEQAFYSGALFGVNHARALAFGDLPRPNAPSVEMAARSVALQLMGDIIVSRCRAQ